MANIPGTNGNDELRGTNNADTIDGLGGEDTLSGLAGNDTLRGGAQPDTLVGSAGNDTLAGGAGLDQVLYYRDGGSLGVVVDLQAGTATDTHGNTDMLVSIERLFGSDTADTLRGSARDDILYGREGDDVIDGRAGDDDLIGNAGADMLSGGVGLDEVIYTFERGSNGIVVDLLEGTARDTWGDRDTLSSIEYIQGSDNDDVIYGSNRESERLFGHDGDDEIDGRDGKNLIVTGAGNDRIFVGTTIEDARDTIVINGNGTKTITGTTAQGSEFAHHIVFATDEAVTVNLAEGIATTASGDMTTDFTGALHFLEVGGTAFDDTLIGGNPRHDFLEWFNGNQGDDLMDGRSGVRNTAVYDPEVRIGFFNPATGVREFGTQGVQVNLAQGRAIDSFGDTDTLRNMDDVRGTLLDDSFTGHDGSNFFWGLEGDDFMDGGAGADDAVLYEDDALFGSTVGVTVNLTTGQATDGFGDTDTLRNIENVIGTEFGDILTGSSVANRLRGDEGADTLAGLAGDDTLLAGSGDDELQGGPGDDQLWGDAGSDTINGGRGVDVVRYQSSEAGVTVNLGAGTASDDGFGDSDTLTSVEWINGSEFDDTLIGDGGENRLVGNAGNDDLRSAGGDDTILGESGDDTINGGAGNDRLWGEAGNDSINGGSGTDIARYLDAPTRVTVDLVSGQASADGFGDSDMLSNMEGAHGSEFGDSLTGDDGDNELFGFGGPDSIVGGDGSDELHGDAGNDTITAGAGDDTLGGDAGLDRLDGGAGTDTALYRSSSEGAQVDLANGAASDGLGNFDELVSIENVRGSDHADSILGSDADNQLFGLGGNDTLYGGAGRDQLIGGAGNDVYHYYAGDGIDTINDATGGNDVVVVHNYLPEHVDVRAGGGNEERVELFFGERGTIDPADQEILFLSNSLSGDLNGAIETVRFADGTEWGQADFVDNLGKTGTNGTANNETAPNRIFDTANANFGNAAPETGDDSAEIAAGSSETINVLSNDSDPDGGTLALDSVGDALFGSTEITNDDRITYTPGEGFNGTDRFAYTVSDGQGGTATATVEITVDNDPPQAADDSASASAGISTTIDVLANDSDPNDDTLSVDSASGASNGTLSDTGDERVRYAPDDGFLGTDSFTYTISDGQGGTATASVTVTVGNDGPTANDDEANTSVGTTVRVDVLANDNDRNSDPLTVDSVEQPANGTTEIRGDGAVNYTPNDGFVGTDSFSYTISDPSDSSATGNVVVTVGAQNLRLIGDQGVNELIGAEGDDFIAGRGGNDVLVGGDGNDVLRGEAGADVLRGEAGDDDLQGGNGADRLIGGDGNDTIDGGDTAADLRDVIFGGAGNDTARGDHGNDELNGGTGNDTLAGGFGADTVIGNAGDDTMTGSAFSDLIFGGPGFDFVNGGFGFDRVNGGADGDRFFHTGDAGHGSDWIQDYNAAEGDVLLYGAAGTADQFRVITTQTPNAGSNAVDEAFVVYQPTGQILWALVDGAGQNAINLNIGGEQFDLF